MNEGKESDTLRDNVYWKQIIIIETNTPQTRIIHSFGVGQFD